MFGLKSSVFMLMSSTTLVVNSSMILHNYAKYFGFLFLADFSNAVLENLTVTDLNSDYRSAFIESEWNSTIQLKDCIIFDTNDFSGNFFYSIEKCQNIIENCYFLNNSFSNSLFDISASEISLYNNTFFMINGRILLIDSNSDALFEFNNFFSFVSDKLEIFSIGLSSNLSMHNNYMSDFHSNSQNGLCFYSENSFINIKDIFFKNVKIKKVASFLFGVYSSINISNALLSLYDTNAIYLFGCNLTLSNSSFNNSQINYLKSQSYIFLLEQYIFKIVMK